MASLRRDKDSDKALHCEGCTNACCIIIHTHTHTHTAECKHTHCGRQQLRLSKAARAEVGNEAEEEEGEQTRTSGRRMSRFVDLAVVTANGRIRNVPLLELLAVSPGPYVPPLWSLDPFKLYIHGGGIWGRRQSVWGWK